MPPPSGRPEPKAAGRRRFSLKTRPAAARERRGVDGGDRLAAAAGEHTAPRLRAEVLSEPSLCVRLSDAQVHVHRSILRRIPALRALVDGPTPEAVADERLPCSAAEFELLAYRLYGGGATTPMPNREALQLAAAAGALGMHDQLPELGQLVRDVRLSTVPREEEDEELLKRVAGVLPPGLAALLQGSGGAAAPEEQEPAPRPVAGSEQAGPSDTGAPAARKRPAASATADEVVVVEDDAAGGPPSPTPAAAETADEAAAAEDGAAGEPPSPTPAAAPEAAGAEEATGAVVAADAEEAAGAAVPGAAAAAAETVEQVTGPEGVAAAASVVKPRRPRAPASTGVAAARKRPAAAIAVDEAGGVEGVAVAAEEKLEGEPEDAAVFKVLKPLNLGLSLKVGSDYIYGDLRDRCKGARTKIAKLVGFTGDASALQRH